MPHLQNCTLGHFSNITEITLHFCLCFKLHTVKITMAQIYARKLSVAAANFTFVLVGMERKTFSVVDPTENKFFFNPGTYKTSRSSLIFTCPLTLTHTRTESLSTEWSTLSSVVCFHRACFQRLNGFKVFTPKSHVPGCTRVSKPDITVFVTRAEIEGGDEVGRIYASTGESLSWLLPAFFLSLSGHSRYQCPFW